MYEGLAGIKGIVCKKPSGAFYIVAKLPVKSAEDFASWILTDFNYENKTVMVAPAEGFYATHGLGKDEIRLSYCIKSEDLKDAMDVFARALSEYKKIKD